VNRELFLSIVRLSKSKRNLSDKIYYLVMGFICYFSLYKKEKNISNSLKKDIETSGDDVYPLF